MGNWTEKNRSMIIGIVTIITLFMLYGFRFLRIESDTTKWLRKDAKEVKSLNYVSGKFGGKDIALVGVESDSIFTFSGLHLLSELEDSFERIKGVSSITSLVNILDIKGSHDNIYIQNLIDRYNLPKTQDSIEKLKEHVLSRDMYRGRVISEDGRVALFIINLTKDANKVVTGTIIRKKAEKVASSYKIPIKLYFSGTPMILKSVNSAIINDIIKLVPIVILIVVFVLYTGMKNTYGVLLPLLVVIISSIWSIGLMGFFHIPLSAVSNTMPVLLIAIGTAYGIHILSTYTRHLKETVRREDAIKLSQREVFVPVLLAGLTTMASFFSFIGSYIVTITHFGIFTGLGVAFSVILSLFFIPALLYKINYKVKTKEESSVHTVWYEKIMEGIFNFIVKREFLSVFVTVLIVLFGFIGFARLKPSSNVLYYFPEKSEVRKSSEFLRRYFKGDIPVYILFKGDLQNPGVLEEMIDFEKFMRARHDVGYPSSYADLIMNLNESSFGYRAVPETEGEVQDLGFMLEGRPELKQLVESNYNEGIINANALESAYEPIKDYFGRRLQRNLSKVNLDTIPLNSRIYDYLASHTSWRILQDAKYRGFSVDTLKVKNILLNVLLEKYSLNQRDIRELEVKIKNIFKDNDVEITDSKVRGILPFIIDNIDTLELEGYVFNIIPEDIKKDDPKIADDISNEIISLKRSFIRDKKIDMATSMILNKMKNKGEASSEFLKDVKGDIYSFFKENVYIPVEIAKSKADVKIGGLYSGVLPILKKVDENLIKSQIKSMLIAIFVVLLLVALDTDSILAGLVATLTIVLVIAINFGIMGILGMKLDAGTMLVASIAIGIGIDYTIHFISHLKDKVREGLTLQEGIRKTIIEKGRAILINAFTVGLGFLVLVFGTLIPIKNFGWMLFLTMLTSATLSLTFLPALILFLKKPFSRVFNRK